MTLDLMLSGNNALFLEELLARYLRDPDSVDASWRAFFQGEGRDLVDDAVQVGPRFESRGIFHAPRNGSAHGRAPLTPGMDRLAAQSAIVQLIEAYRTFGHMNAHLDPLGLSPRRVRPELDPAYWGLAPDQLDETFSTAALCLGPQTMTLRELLAVLQETYCGSIGCETMHINDAEMQEWLQRRIERDRNRCELDETLERYILDQLCAATAFEHFIHVKFRGAKRFSLEGGEALVPLLDLLIDESAQLGVREVVLGMPHRGRLNILTHIFEKTPREIFVEFEDRDHALMIGRGDVKYHLGYSTDRVTRRGHPVHLSLTFNPSHLEAINPVVSGRARAKQDRHGDHRREEVLPVLLHGDAAFMGQGLVAETLNLMGLDGYTTGGTIHVVVNNQIGFTTLPMDSRSVPYCTDIAKMVEVPIFHVNGEDLEAVAQVVRIASEFRARFHADCIIDLVCFRRHGHNESDEPSFTQPVMYQAIQRHPIVRDVYAAHLAARGRVTHDEVARATEVHEARFNANLQQVRDGTGEAGASSDEAPSEGPWCVYRGGLDRETPEVDTTIDVGELQAVVDGLVDLPDGFICHPRLDRLQARRAAVTTGETPIDWGMAESLAYGSLVRAGHRVRLTGQDVCRGTFSHRHAVLTDPRDGRQHCPLSAMARGGGVFEIHNSPLSEAAVLGFEFGYSLDMPEALVIWEAQFGDFANGAQVIIDQFISASEDKWGRLSGVTLLLPHGYEGQGPEHSSSRLERFLALCAEDNMQVANLTTPAQIFHALRRQVLRPWRKPMVIMTPKSLLRHKGAVSTVEDLTEGRFQRVIDDVTVSERSRIRRIVLCSGKVYYDLLERRAEVSDPITAIVRLELLYPFPQPELEAVFGGYEALEEIIWCQEEPANMGGFAYLCPRLVELCDGRYDVSWTTRDASASPATGSYKAHQLEQAQLVSEIFPPPK